MLVPGTHLLVTDGTPFVLAGAVMLFYFESCASTKPAYRFGLHRRVAVGVGVAVCTSIGRGGCGESFLGLSGILQLVLCIGIAVQFLQLVFNAIVVVHLFQYVVVGSVDYVLCFCIMRDSIAEFSCVIAAVSGLDKREKVFHVCRLEVRILEDCIDGQPFAYRAEDSSQILGLDVDVAETADNSQ